MSLINIAIDGPSGSGKSTAAKNLAARLNIEYIDTGAMYRAVAYKSIQKGVELEDEAIGKMLEDTDIDFVGGNIYLDGENVNGVIRTLEVSAKASTVSALPSCRAKLVDIQRKIAASKSVVMDGRDIASNVLPNASHKFFVTCDLDIRAERRYAELQAKGDSVSLEEVRADLAQRDHNDSTRKLNPLRKADDAIEIATDDISIPEVTELLVSYIEK